jgi:ERF superfamily
VTAPIGTLPHRESVSAIATIDRAELVREQPTSPVAIIDLLRLAIEKGIPVEALERLQALHERVSDRAAAAEFANAVATFQRHCPPISRNAKVDYVTASGARVSFNYSALDHIVRTIGPHLHPVGLSYTWDTVIREKLVEVRCTLRHLNGHAATSLFSVPIESKAGMSEQQKYSAAVQFGRRLSLVNVLGLVSGDPESPEADPTPITADQAMDLEALIEETGVVKARFLEWAGVKTVAEIRAVNYEACVRAVRRHAATAAKAAKSEKAR